MENRIEQKMQQLKQKGKKAFITYMMAGHPDMEKCKSLIQAQEHAGVDVLELGIPFSDRRLRHLKYTLPQTFPAQNAGPYYNTS